MSGNGARYLTLDDELTLMSARQDPVGMIRSLDRAVIDEIQRAPSLLLAIKKSIDEDRRPGRFLLTGSANLMALPTVADSPAGFEGLGGGFGRSGLARRISRSPFKVYTEASGRLDAAIYRRPHST
jgi:hypothetical protein